MSGSLLRTDKEIAEIYTRHSKMLYRVCFAYMKNAMDTEDAVQETFFHLVRSGPAFVSAEHEKAWLIRTVSNICKNALRHWWRKRENIEDFQDIQSGETVETDEVFHAVMDLPEKYKTVVYLYYYEGYTGAEIAGILNKPQSTIRNSLREARALLKERLGDSFYDE